MEFGVTKKKNKIKKMNDKNNTDTNNLSEFSLDAGKLLGTLNRSKKAIVSYYGEESVKRLEDALVELWMIARNKG